MPGWVSSALLLFWFYKGALILHTLAGGNALGVGVLVHLHFGRVVGGILQPRGRVAACDDDFPAVLGKSRRFAQQGFVQDVAF